jgi:ribonucleoside-diphosphate reductase alpha chain
MEPKTQDSVTREVYSVANRIVTLDYTRDALLTEFGKQTLTDRYLWKGENFQKMFARVAAANSDNNDHAQRMYDYISKLWFMPSTPVLSNSGHSKNLPISCYLNAVGDSLEEISETLTENFWLASRGGGIGTSWTEVRDIGEPVGDRGQTSGIIPFIKMQDSATVGISQGSLRRGSAAVYLDVSHPEIEEFIEVRDPTGDANRRSLNIHHGVTIPDAFMEAVKAGGDWMLIHPHTGKVHSVVKARHIWQKIVMQRLKTGEPYIWFVDTVNRSSPASYKLNGLKNTQSNLCSEIALSTGIDYNNRRRTAVCCLSSLNLETYEEWKGVTGQIVEDAMRFLDNVLEHFIKLTDGVIGFERANYAARMERSVGLGVMGFHGFLQSKLIPFEGVMAKVWNKKIFSSLQEASKLANWKIALDKGACPDAARVGLVQRFTHVWAIAPTASISIIAGESSPGIEPTNANVYKQKTLSGWHMVRNKYLSKLLSDKWDQTMAPEWGDRAAEQKEIELKKVWKFILSKGGSVQELSFLNQNEKDTFKTALEMNQMWIIELAGDRQPFICQGQSVNVFIPSDVDKNQLNKLHYKAWELGLKGLYYCRSVSIQRATDVAHVAGELPQSQENDEGCLACQ